MSKSIVIFLVFGTSAYSLPNPLDTIILAKKQDLFPLILGSEKIVTKKIWNPKTLNIEMVSESFRVKSPEDLVQLEDNEKAMERRKYGNFSHDLRASYERMSDEDELDVAIYPKIPSIPFMDKTKHTEAELKAHARDFFGQKPKVGLETILLRYGIKSINSLAYGQKVVTVTKATLKKIKTDEDIATIEPWSIQVPLTQPYSTLSTSAYNPLSEMPSDSRGQGIEAATVEIGLASNLIDWNNNFVPYGNLVGCAGVNTSRVRDVYSKLNSINGTNTDWPKWEHSQQTFAILKYTAPMADLFHIGFKSIIPAYNEWNADILVRANYIRTVSLSYTRLITNPNCPGEYGHQTYDANYLEFIDIDRKAMVHPFTLYCNPAGNKGHQFEVEWQSYNGMSVGNVQHSNLNHYQFAQNNDASLDVCANAGAATRSRNPKARYGGPALSTPNSVYPYGSGDREMPYIVAPGFTPDNVSMSDPCVPGPIWAGTSYSAPVLNGIAACVISANRSAMINWPEKVRAVLLATAQNVHGSDWNSNIDGQDGAGVVSGANAVAFAKNHTSVYSGSMSATDGIGEGSVTASNFSSANLVYNIKIPSTKPPGKHLRVVLTWSSNAITENPDGSTNIDNRLSDLDLIFGNATGLVLGFSASYNGNVEIVDIPSSSLTASGDYFATINKYTNRIPPGGHTYYCIAWTWVKDHAI